MLGIPIGLLYSNASEWVIHRYVLHGLGKRKSSFWSFHWHQHHLAARRHGFVDEHYQRSPFGWHAQGKEALCLVVMAAAHAPLLPVAPFFTLTVFYCAWNYHRVHKRAHVDPEWAREHVPWHVAHHMNPDQDRNWCVTRPWFDRLLGTASAGQTEPSGLRNLAISSGLRAPRT